MRWRRKPDGRPYADLRDIGLGRVSLLTKSIIREYGTTPPDDVCDRLYDELISELGPVVAGKSGRTYSIAQIVKWYVETYKGTAPKGTQEAAKYHLMRWETWCTKRQITQPDEFDSVMAQEYGAALAKACTPGSAKTYMTAVKSMFNAATQTGILDKSPVSTWPRFPKTGSKVRYYTADQLREVLTAVREHQPDYYPIILFIAATGWAVGDATALEHSNIDKARRVANRRRRKTNVSMLLPLNATALEAVELSRTFTGLVFPGRRGMPLHPHAVYLALKRAKDKAGIKYTCTLHMFRHTLAVELTRRGTPLAIVAQILGHDPKTTLEYYQTFAPSSGAPYLDGWDAQLRGDTGVCHPNVTPFPEAK